MTRKTPRRRKGRGTLHILTALLVCSALLRLPPGAGEALAQAAPDPAMQPVPTAAAPSAIAPGPLLAALQEREAAVEAREAALADRLQALRVAESEIAEQLTALQQAEAALAATIALAEEAASNDLARLTTVYENMKPQQTAALFSEMAPEFAAGFLGLMRPEAAALIMTNLEPDIAHSISVVLAGRNARVPTE